MSYTIEDIARIIGARRIGIGLPLSTGCLQTAVPPSFPKKHCFCLCLQSGMTVPVISVICMRAAYVILWSAKRGWNEVGIGEPKVEDAARQETVDTAAMQPAFNLLVVSNPLKALQKLAEQHRDRFQIPVIGITGSNGNHCEGGCISC